MIVDMNQDENKIEDRFLIKMSRIIKRSVAIYSVKLSSCLLVVIRFGSHRLTIRNTSHRFSVETKFLLASIYTHKRDFSTKSVLNIAEN